MVASNSVRHKRRRPNPKSPPRSDNSFTAAIKRNTAFCFLLGVATIALYSPVAGHAFLIFDDHDYVTANPHIREGLSWNTVKWAFSSTAAANWHPLTWLSHALDCQLFGLNPAGHHLDSVFIHALNAMLLFLLLVRLTRRARPSLFVAALFALHPINVETVAWVAERKNVLSTFFFFLAIGAYTWYVRRPHWRGYLLVAALFAAGLIAKPMIVTLPCVLMLLDYWPLQRIQNHPPSMIGIPQFTLSKLLLEKVPLLILSVVSAVITIAAQRSGQAVRTLHQFPLGVRIENAGVSYGLYLWKMLWPARLAPLYPRAAGTLPGWQLVLSALVLLTITLLVLFFRSRRYLLVGWLWFLGTLVPVIGLVQVGDAAMADRYAYIPLIGVFVMIAWTLADLAEAEEVSNHWQAIAVLGLLAALSMVTLKQLSYWQSEYSLWTHTLAVTDRNPFAHDAMGSALMEPDVAAALNHMENLGTEQKRTDEARRQYQEALQIRREYAQQNPAAYLPDMASTLNNLGNLERLQGRRDEARKDYEESVKIHRQLSQQGLDPYPPDMAMALDNLGFLERLQKQPEQAYLHFEEALQIYRDLVRQSPDTYLPEMAMTLNNMAISEKDQNRLDESRRHYEEALQIRRQLAQQAPGTYLPDVAMTLNDLGNLDGLQKEMEQARQHYGEACTAYRQLARQEPGTYLPYVAGTLNNLGFLDRNENRIEESRAHYTEALSDYRELAQADSERYTTDIARVVTSLKELEEKVPSK